MKHTINTAIHTTGGLVLLLGLVLAVKAAGLADLGGELTEIAALCKCSLAAMACSLFLQKWRI